MRGRKVHMNKSLKNERKTNEPLVRTAMSIQCQLGIDKLKRYKK